MGQSFQDNDKQLRVLEAQIRECFGRVVWSHKTQEKCADILLRRERNIKIWQIVLSALITTSILTSLFGESRIGIIIGVIFSTMLVVLNTYMKNYNLSEIAQDHSNAANELWNIRETYLSILTDIRAKALTISQVQQKRDELQEKLANIYKGAPRTIAKAYLEAKKALKFNEELTFSDQEIDMLLPKELKKGAQKES